MGKMSKRNGKVATDLYAVARRVRKLEQENRNLTATTQPSEAVITIHDVLPIIRKCKNSNQLRLTMDWVDQMAENDRALFDDTDYSLLTAAVTAVYGSFDGHATK